jgi:hypothetical protein
VMRSRKASGGVKCGLNNEENRMDPFLDELKQNNESVRDGSTARRTLRDR